MRETSSYKSYMKSKYLSIKHSTYFHSYDHFFNQYRGKPITFVEIGVLNGGSLFMWRDYFGEKARIIGVDLNPAAKKWEEYGFEIYVGSQSDTVFWRNFLNAVGKLDIVLDDGGHTYDQQIITVESLADNINDGGIIVVEDTHTSYMNGFGPKRYTFLNYVKRRIDAINFRFSHFTHQKAERRIWSIEVVESMVAFKIRIEPSRLQSIETTNDGASAKAIDYRNDDIMLYKWIKRSELLVRLLRNSKLMSRLSRLVVNFIASKNFKSRKFFR